MLTQYPNTTQKWKTSNNTMLEEPCSFESHCKTSSLFVQVGYGRRGALLTQGTLISRQTEIKKQGPFILWRKSGKHGYYWIWVLRVGRYKSNGCMRLQIVHKLNFTWVTYCWNFNCAARRSGSKSLIGNMSRPFQSKVTIINLMHWILP